MSIDISGFKEEHSGLEAFLTNKLNIKTVIENKILRLDLMNEKVARGKLKDYLERYFYREGLSEKYKVRFERDLIKIVEKKSSRKLFSFKR